MKSVKGLLVMDVDNTLSGERGTTTVVEGQKGVAQL